MALGIQTESASSGEFKARLQFDARAGRMFRVDRSNASGQWQSVKTDVSMGFKAAIDFASIEVGWISFAGVAPDFRVVPLGHPMPARPGDKDDKGNSVFKSGFRAKFVMPDGEVRELSHTARCVVEAIDALHTAYLAAPEAVAGKIPVVSLVSTTPVVSGQGEKKSTNYRPDFQIVAWIDRPLALGAATAVVSNAAAQPTPAAAPAPQPAPAPAPVAAPPAQAAAGGALF